MLKVEKLKVHGLPPLSFEVPAGECLAIEGPSGSGKTLVLRAVADLDAAEGYVFLEGAERQEMPAPAWRRQVRYAAAEPAWWAATPRPHFVSDPNLNALVATLGLAPTCLDQPLDRLSTGERQRLALVRAIADRPKVLLLDEPTSALDDAASGLVEDLIRSCLEAGTIVILVSHDSGLVLRQADARLQLAKPQATAKGAAA